MSDLQANCRLWFFAEGSAGVFGDGKVRLLREIDRCGSLRQAALALDVSYRKAWGDLNKAESCLGRQLIVRRRGGRDGGQTRLTEDGRRWIDAYEQFSGAVRQHIQNEYERHLRPLL